METPDPNAQQASKIAADILHSLGFECTVDIAAASPEEISLDVSGPDCRFIIGDGGSRLDDLQYLVNRLLVTSCETAPRVRVDCDGYRAKAESRLVQSAVEKAQRVLAGGNSITLPPMNAYHRRLVHSALAEIPGVSTHSEEGDSRFKRIVISPSS